MQVCGRNRVYLSQTGPLYDIKKFCLIKKAFRFSFTNKQAAENLEKKEVN